MQIREMTPLYGDVSVKVAQQIVALLVWVRIPDFPPRLLRRLIFMNKYAKLDVVKVSTKEQVEIIRKVLSRPTEKATIKTDTKFKPELWVKK